MITAEYCQKVIATSILFVYTIYIYACAGLNIYFLFTFIYNQLQTSLNTESTLYKPYPGTGTWYSKFSNLDNRKTYSITQFLPKTSLKKSVIYILHQHYKMWATQSHTTVLSDSIRGFLFIYSCCSMGFSPSLSFYSKYAKSWLSL